MFKVSDSDKEIIFNSIIKSLKEDISKTKEILLWRGDSKLNKFVKETLDTLDKILDDKDKRDKIEKSITSDRFDKKALGLENTIIYGEDGGLYLLLNSANETQEAILEES